MPSPLAAIVRDAARRPQCGQRRTGTGRLRPPRERRQSRSGRLIREINWGAIRSSGRIAVAAPIAAAAFGIP